MGCGSSQAAKVANIEGSSDKNVPNISLNNTEISDDMSLNEIVDENGTTVMIPMKYPPGEAFEIPLKPEPDSSLIKKHPPRRLQKLLEDRPQTPHSIEDLEEKLEHAKLRRQQILSQRIENTIKLRENKDKDNNDVIDDLEEEHQEVEDGSRIKTAMGKNDTSNGSRNENEGNHLNEEILHKNQLNAN